MLASDSMYWPQTVCIGLRLFVLASDSMYWPQTVSATDCIGLRLYWPQTVLTSDCYWPQTESVMVSD